MRNWRPPKRERARSFQLNFEQRRFSQQASDFEQRHFSKEASDFEPHHFLKEASDFEPHHFLKEALAEGRGQEQGGGLEMT
jgi:hypothetical protein